MIKDGGVRQIGFLSKCLFRSKHRLAVVHAIDFQIEFREKWPKSL
jgi:hypothetical protein